jgi:hypothetical protein
LKGVGQITGAALRPDGRVAVVVADQRSVLVDVRTGARLATLPLLSGQTRLPVFSADGRWLATSEGTQRGHCYDLKALEAQLAEVRLGWEKR